MLVNGKLFEINNLINRSIFSLLDHLKLPYGSVAIERNGEILDKELWKENLLGETDRIEIIKFVGGG